MRHLPLSALLAAALAACAPRAAAEIKLVGKATIPATATDRSGLKDTLKDGIPHSRLGGLGSGIAYTGRGNRYVLVPDRGPADGGVPYLCRMHFFDIELVKDQLTASLVETVLLKDLTGEHFVGMSSALGKTKAGTPLRLDPEGVRVGKTGTIFISDEYGPYIHEFDRKGRRLRSLPVPAHLQIAHPNADEKIEKRDNTTGRLPNKGMEALAITPDGSKLYGCMQSPLIQDGGRNGTNVRLLGIATTGGATREYLYPLAEPRVAVSEIVAINDHQFLVLERDGKTPKGQKKFKKLFKIDVTGATDISAVQKLPVGSIPKDITPVRKELFLDMLTPHLGLDTAELPDKIEGLAFGPDLADGRHLLLVTSDNDFSGEHPTHIYAFAIDPSDLPGYQPQRFAP